MANSEEGFVNLQIVRLRLRYERDKAREKFVKKHMKLILSLSMAGWPKTRNMKDYLAWLPLIYKAKLLGIYALTTANCDVIANLSRFAKVYSSKIKKIR